MSLIILSAADEKITYSRFQNLTVQSLNCEQLKSEIQKLLPPGKEAGDDQFSLPSENLQPAIQLIDKFPTPTNGDVEIEMAAIEQDLDRVVTDYFTLLGTGCRPLRLDLSRWIVNTAMAKTASPSDKSAAKAALKAMLQKPQHPYFLAAAMNQAIVQFGLDKKFWTLNKANLAAFEKLRKDFRSITQTQDKSWKKVLDIDLYNNKKLPREEFSKFLRDHPKFFEVKRLMAEEAHLAKKALEDTSTLAATL